MSNTRITKDVAEGMAKKLIQPKVDEVNRLFSDFYAEVEDLYFTALPKEIKEAYKLHSQYLNLSSRACLNSSGFSYAWVDFSKRLPSPSHNEIEFSGEIMGQLLKKYSSIKAKKEEVYNLSKQIEATIYNLRSYTKIQEVFPEAAVFLPIDRGNVTAVSNIDELRAKLKVDENV